MKPTLTARKVFGAGRSKLGPRFQGRKLVGAVCSGMFWVRHGVECKGFPPPRTSLIRVVRSKAIKTK